MTPQESQPNTAQIHLAETYKMLYILLTVIGILAVLILGKVHKMALAVSDILTQIAAIKTQIDAITPPVAEDLQPVADALTAVSAELTTKFPPAA